MFQAMTEAEMKELLSQRAEKINAFMNDWLNANSEIPTRLKEAMLYTLNAGGKRLRPCLCLSWASLCGADEACVVPFAGAIEMIHTYSLVHDDLPAMDNDDLRRGKPTCHRAFDEAAAILAGDALLTDAFALASETRLECACVLRAMRELALAAGSSGMAGGQMLDMLYTGKNKITLSELTAMQALKTGAMIKASCLCGAILAKASAAMLSMCRSYGSALGKAFQIADDVLDVIGDTQIMGKKAGSDTALEKNTWPAVAGLAQAQAEASREADLAISSLDGLPGREAEFLRGLALYAIQRQS